MSRRFQQTPQELYFELGLRPSTTKLRRRSRDVSAVFLNGYSLERIAHALCVHIALIEDAIRWEMKRRDKALQRRSYAISIVRRRHG